MDHLATLRRLRATPSSIVQRFRTQHRAGSTDVYAFFEGAEDACFYVREIQRHITAGGALISYVCDGKPNLLLVADKISKEFSGCSRVLFFMDKDVDDYVGANGCQNKSAYTTAYYSIENYLVTQDVLRALWAETLHLDADDPRLPDVIKMFEAEHASFVRAVRFVMGWIIAVRRVGGHIVLKEIDPKRLVKKTTTGVYRKQRGLLTYLGNFVTTRPPSIVTVTDVRRAVKQLSAAPAKTWIRGKLELWWFVAFLNAIVSALSKRGGKVKRATPRVALTTSNAVELLSAKTLPPVECREFIASNLA